MKEKLAKLIDVKSIMTLLLTLVFCILALCGLVTATEFVTIFTVIVGFYFGTQSQKKDATATVPTYPGTAYAAAETDEESKPATGEGFTANAIHPPDQQ